MGIRGELFSTKVLLQNRTYFFNVKENRLGDLYLNIVESKNKDSGGFDRQSVVLFAEDLTDFLKGFDESLRVLEKADREKRRGKNKAGNERGNRARDNAEEDRSRTASAKPGKSGGEYRKSSGAASGSGRPKVKLSVRTKKTAGPGKGKSGAGPRGRESGNREKPAKRIVVKRAGKPE
ncbi:MAG: DUF3276 family protein [Spirochaetaceae bacterium]|jgi:hypothetical protein|nr:DUF3276 family protein [Spirochaetaceae bacterium]